MNSVPQSYLGVWRRTLLAQAGQSDTSTLVLWLQTAQHHADIRIPANRPSFDNIHQLEDCSPEQLAWLATQQGFCGTTQVQGNIAKWHREHDFQPANNQRDIGEMQFETDSLLIETGLEADYLEKWEKLANSHLNLSVKQTSGTNRHGEKMPAKLLTANTTFAYVRPRNTQLPASTNLLTAIQTNQPNQAQLFDWLDFEISFGEIASGAHEANVAKNAFFGTITHSTFPFKEGKNFELAMQ